MPMTHDQIRAEIPVLRARLQDPKWLAGRLVEALDHPESTPESEEPHGDLAGEFAAIQRQLRDPYWLSVLLHDVLLKQRALSA